MDAHRSCRWGTRWAVPTETWFRKRKHSHSNNSSQPHTTVFAAAGNSEAAQAQHFCRVVVVAACKLSGRDEEAALKALAEMPEGVLETHTAAHLKNGEESTWWNAEGATPDQHALWNAEGATPDQHALWNAEGTTPDQHALWNAEGTVRS